MGLTIRKNMCARCGKRRKRRRSSYCKPCFLILTQRHSN